MGALKGRWVPPDLRDQIVDFIRYWAPRAELPVNRLLSGIGLGRSKFAAWKARYGRVNEHNAWIPRDFWLQDWEKQAIIDFFLAHPQDGYRRITYRMLDADIVAVSPVSVYRVLKNAGLLRRGAPKPSKKGRIVHWEIRAQMTEADVEIVLQRAREAFPEAQPRIISDNGPQFIARDFKAFVRLMSMTHVRTSPFYPQNNGKLERWHKSLKSEAIRPKTPLSLEDAKRVVSTYVEEYDSSRLHSAIGDITPSDKLQGRAEFIFAERNRKLEAARQARRQRRAAVLGASATSTPVPAPPPPPQTAP